MLPRTFAECAKKCGASKMQLRRRTATVIGRGRMRHPLWVEHGLRACYYPPILSSPECRKEQSHAAIQRLPGTNHVLPLAQHLHRIRRALPIKRSTAPPPTERHDVTETFFGQSVTDQYRWLEDWKSAKVEEWLKAQNDHTSATLASIPGREKFLARVKALDTAGTVVHNAQVWGGMIFYLKADPGADNFKLYVRDRAGSPERLLLDPQLLTKDGVHYSIDYFQASLDGTLVAYGIPRGVLKRA